MGTEDNRTRVARACIKEISRLNATAGEAFDGLATVFVNLALRLDVPEDDFERMLRQACITYRKFAAERRV